MTQLIIARKALGPSLSLGGGLEVLPGFQWGFSHPVLWDSGMWLSPIGPTRVGIAPAAPWHQFWGFFWHFQPWSRRQGCCLMECAAGARQSQHHLDNDWRQPGPQKWDIPSWGGPVVLTRCLHVPILSPSFPGSCQLCSQGMMHQHEGSRGVFSLQS